METEKLIDSLVKKVDAVRLLSEELGDAESKRLIAYFEAKIREVKAGTQRVIHGEMNHRV